MSYLLQDTSFWTAVGLIAFFIVIWRFGAFNSIGKALDDRADAIRNELDEARRLREEAQELLANFKRQQADAAEEAKATLRQAKADADYMREEAQREIAERVERRTALAKDRIAQAETAARNEIRALAADLAVEAAKELLTKKMTKTQRNALVKSDISSVGDRLN